MENLEGHLAQLRQHIGVAHADTHLRTRRTRQGFTAAEIARMVSAIEADVNAFVARPHLSREPRLVFETAPDRKGAYEAIYARSGREIYGKVCNDDLWYAAGDLYRGVLPREFPTTPRDVAEFIVTNFYFDNSLYDDAGHRRVLQ